MYRVLPPAHGFRWVVGGPNNTLRVPQHLFDGDVPPPVVVMAIEQVAAARSASRVFSATALTSQDCNLRCPYCIQNTSSSPVQRVSDVRMTPERATEVAQYICAAAARGEADQITLLLFGGEPLMAPEACQVLLENVRPTNASVWTNGALLTASRIDPLVDRGLDTIFVTFDGGRTTHDLTRSNLAGRGTYDLVLANVLETAKRHPHLNWVVRSSLMPQTADTQHALVADLSQLPKRAATASLILGLVDDIGIGFDNVTPYSPDVAAEMVSINRAARAAGFHTSLRTPISSCVYCSDPTLGITIDADGTLYSCWQTAGRTEWSIGSLEGGIDPAQLPQRWVACDVNAAPHGNTAERDNFWNLVDQDILDASIGLDPNDE